MGFVVSFGRGGDGAFEAGIGGVFVAVVAFNVAEEDLAGVAFGCVLVLVDGSVLEIELFAGDLSFSSAAVGENVCEKMAAGADASPLIDGFMGADAMRSPAEVAFMTLASVFAFTLIPFALDGLAGLVFSPVCLTDGEAPRTSGLAIGGVLAFSKVGLTPFDAVNGLDAPCSSSAFKTPAWGGRVTVPDVLDGAGGMEIDFLGVGLAVVVFETLVFASRGSAFFGAADSPITAVFADAAGIVAPSTSTFRGRPRFFASSVPIAVKRVFSKRKRMFTNSMFLSRCLKLPGRRV